MKYRFSIYPCYACTQGTSRESHLPDGHNQGMPQEALVLDLSLHICLVVLDLARIQAVEVSS